MLGRPPLLSGANSWHLNLVICSKILCAFLFLRLCDNSFVVLQVADEHQLTLNLEMPQASRAQAQAAPKQKAGQSEQQDDLTARLAELRGR